MVVGVEVEVAIVDPFRDVFLIGTFTIGLRRPELLDIDHVRCAPATEASLPLPVASLPLPEAAAASSELLFTSRSDTLATSLVDLSALAVDDGMLLRELTLVAG